MSWGADEPLGSRRLLGSRVSWGADEGLEPRRPLGSRVSREADEGLGSGTVDGLCFAETDRATLGLRTGDDLAVEAVDRVIFLGGGRADEHKGSRDRLRSNLGMFAVGEGIVRAGAGADDPTVAGAVDASPDTSDAMRCRRVA